jgi:hypothetical protein
MQLNRNELQNALPVRLDGVDAIAAAIAEVLKFAAQRSHDARESPDQSLRR